MENLNLILYNLAQMTVKKFLSQISGEYSKLYFHIWKIWGSGLGAKSQIVDLRPQGMDDMGGSKGL